MEWISKQDWIDDEAPQRLRWLREQLIRLQKHVEMTNKDVLNSIGADGRCPALHMAADYGINLMVEYLLSKGANVNSKMQGSFSGVPIAGVTPLFVAAIFGHVDIAETLVNHGADVKIMIKGFNLLSAAVMSNNPSMIEMVLNLKFNIDDYDPEGRTALMVAVKFNMDKSVKFLLDKGADYDICTPRKPRFPPFNPLLVDAVRCANGCCEILLNLLQHMKEKEGTEKLKKYVNTLDPVDGVAPLHAACALHNYTAVRILLEYGADFETESRDGYKPENYLPLHKDPSAKDTLDLIQECRQKKARQTAALYRQYLLNS